MNLESRCKMQCYAPMSYGLWAGDNIYYQPQQICVHEERCSTTGSDDDDNPITASSYRNFCPHPGRR